MIKEKPRIITSIALVFTMIFVAFLAKNSSMATIKETGYIPIYSVDREEKVASLTFDINWADEENLYSILDTLDQYNVKGTFFIMGGWVNFSNENVDKLKAIYERGHEIGNHSYKHPMFSSISDQRISEELKKTDEIIEKYTGQRPKLFRFPSGEYNKESYKTVVSLGYIPIQWDVDSVDWREDGEDIEYARIKKGLRPGSIILFHNNAKYTNNNLKRLLEEYTGLGYKFVPVSELIYAEDSNINQTGIQQKK